jgi:hypothetical protein
MKRVYAYYISPNRTKLGHFRGPRNAARIGSNPRHKTGPFHLVSRWIQASRSGATDPSSTAADDAGSMPMRVDSAGPRASAPLLYFIGRKKPASGQSPRTGPDRTGPHHHELPPPPIRARRSPKPGGAEPKGREGARGGGGGRRSPQSR